MKKFDYLTEYKLNCYQMSVNNAMKPVI